MSSQCAPFILSVKARSWTRVAQPYSFLSAIALATADPNHARPSHVSRAKASTSTIHKMEKPTKGHEAPQPASQSGPRRSALNCRVTY